MSGTPTPHTQRLRVEPLDQWGNLIKSWATQENYIDTPFTQQPPRNNRNGQTLSVPWRLPSMRPVAIPRDGGPVSLPWAVALTVPEFTALLAAVQFNEDGKPEPQHLTVDMPPQYQHIIIVQGDANTMVLRLPPTDTLQGSEDDLTNGVPYPIPAFYTEHYKPEHPIDPKYGSPSDRVKLVPPTSQDKIMELHAYRIGEYTLNTCN